MDLSDFVSLICTTVPMPLPKTCHKQRRPSNQTKLIPYGHSTKESRDQITEIPSDLVPL